MADPSGRMLFIFFVTKPIFFFIDSSTVCDEKYLFDANLMLEDLQFDEEDQNFQPYADTVEQFG